VYYRPAEGSGLPFNPFKACCVPRPIGWISTVSRDGVHNLAPYSQFQNLTWDPPTVMVAANCRPDGSPKDTAANAIDTGELVWSMATWTLRDAVVASSTEHPPGVDEFARHGIGWLPSREVAPRRVAGSPVHFECRLRRWLHLPGNTPAAGTHLLIAEVVGVHVEPAALRDGRIDLATIQPLARLGYRDYTRVTEVVELADAERLTGRTDDSIAFLKEPGR
jgi:flavin reductase (DIM6/NTAB) family NADH-FMN oxidoreductase RutF